MSAPDVSAAVDEAVRRAKGEPVPERVAARFAIEPELDEKETEAQGRPVFRETEWIYIQVPTSPQTQKFRANDQHRQRFAKAYHWFHDNQRPVASGFPILEWNAITKTKAHELLWYGIKTVEELAGWDLDSRPLSKEDGALVAYARDYLAKRDEQTARIEELEAEVKKLKRKLRETSNEPADSMSSSG